jgi:site-specific DNA-methyltransferase (adenine-specific)
VVLDPFAGSGTTGVAAVRHGRRFIGVEVARPYAELCARRVQASLGDARAPGPAANPAHHAA